MRCLNEIARRKCHNILKKSIIDIFVLKETFSLCCSLLLILVNKKPFMHLTKRKVTYVIKNADDIKRLIDRLR